jgi:hypothetical protein
MARDFDVVTDRIDIANTWNHQDVAFTISFHAYVNATDPGQLLYTEHASGDAASSGVEISQNSSGTDRFRVKVFHGGIDPVRASSNGGIATGAWHVYAVTWDGGTTASNFSFYRDGGELGYASAGTNGTGGADAVGGSHSFGGLIYNDSNNSACRICEFGMWDRILSLSEIQGLGGDKKSPLFYPRGLRLYPKDGMRRETPHNYISGETATLDGTSVIAHPRVFYPTRGYVGLAAATAPPVVSGGAPHMSLLGVGD